jgi:hypothetical protein
VSLRLCPYCGHEKLKKEGEGFDFIFLGGLVLEGKSKSLLNFCCCLGAYLKLCLRLMLI